MRTAFYIIVLVIMFAFLLLSKFNWIIIVALIFFAVLTLIRFLYFMDRIDNQ